MQHILIVDDDFQFLKSLQQLLSMYHYQVAIENRAKNTLNRIKQDHYDLILMDVSMPELNGLDLLRKICADYPHIPIIMISGTSNISTAMEAVKIGAFDFIEKPIDPEKLLPLLDIALNTHQNESSLTSFSKNSEILERFVGISKVTNEIKKQISKLAKLNVSILIVGESGTGKELVADMIHLLSDRRNKPFIKVNCAAIPSELLESELFGYKKGAFTGAYQDKPGKFKLADGGILFLDEIGDMPLHLQSKLLRVLEEDSIEALGSTQKMNINVRIISATNYDLSQRIRDNLFRLDLLYRINKTTILIPPLRERKEDIPVLIDYYLQHFMKIYNRKIKKISRRAKALLMSYDWPGNVRELKNIIERIVIFSEDNSIIEITDVNNAFKMSVLSHSNGIDLSDKIKPLQKAKEEFEKKYIINVLNMKDWQIRNAARILGIDRTTLFRKLKQYGIQHKKLE